MSEHKQFAVVVEQPAQNGYPPMVNYVDAHNPHMIGCTSTINPPPPHYTYSALELRATMELLRRLHPEAQIEAHEVAHIDHRAMIDRWSKARNEWKASLAVGPDEPFRFPDQD